MAQLDGLDNKTDEEVAKLVLADQENFLHIVNRYKAKLFNYIRRISNSTPEETEDILQNVFLKVYLNINDFDDGLKFSSWIYRIAHNEVIDNHRKHKARPQTVGLETDDGQIRNLVADIDIEKDLDNNLLRTRIMKALDELDLKYREIIILKFFEEKDYKEISDIIKKPMGTVASRVNKAKSELKKCLISNV